MASWRPFSRPFSRGGDWDEGGGGEGEGAVSWAASFDHVRMALLLTM